MLAIFVPCDDDFDTYFIKKLGERELLRERYKDRDRQKEIEREKRERERKREGERESFLFVWLVS